MNFLKQTKKEAGDAFDYASDFDGRLRDAKRFGKSAQRYGAQSIKHPMKPVDDVRNFTSGVLKESISDDQHTLILFAGILYFLLSHKHFRDLFNTFLKKIPLIGAFPHVVNTALFLSLLYLVYFSKISVDIEEKIDQLGDLVHT